MRIFSVLLLVLAAVPVRAGDDYMDVEAMATCSAYYSWERDAQEDESEKKGFVRAEARVFAHLEKEMGRETAIHMTRASWHTWKLLATNLPQQRYDSIAKVLAQSCLKFQ
jgi:hypothetical protein